MQRNRSFDYCSLFEERFTEDEVDTTLGVKKSNVVLVITMLTTKGMSSD